MCCAYDVHLHVFCCAEDKKAAEKAEKERVRAESRAASRLSKSGGAPEQPAGPSAMTLQRRKSSESLSSLRSLYGTGGTLVRGAGFDEPSVNYVPGSADGGGGDIGEEAEDANSDRPALFATDQIVLTPTVFASDDEVAKAKTFAVNAMQEAVQKAQGALTIAPAGSWSASDLPARITSRLQDTRGGEEPFSTDPDSVDALKIAKKYGLKAAILQAANVLQFDLDALAAAVWAAVGDIRTSGDLEDEDWSDWANQVHLPAASSKKARRASWNVELELSGGQLLGQNVLDALRALKEGAAANALATLTHQLSSAVYAGIPEGTDSGVRIFSLNTARGGKPVQDAILAVAAIFQAHDSTFGDRTELPLSKWTPDMKKDVTQAIAMIETGTAPEMEPSDVRRIRSAVSQEAIAPVAYLQALAITRDSAFHTAAKNAVAPFNATYYTASIRGFEDIAFQCSVGGEYFSMDTSTGPFCQQCTNAISADVHFETKEDFERSYSALVGVFGQPVVCTDKREDPEHNVKLVFRFMEMLVEVTLSFHATVKIAPLSKVARTILAINVKEGVVTSGLDKIFDYYAFDRVKDVKCKFPL